IAKAGTESGKPFIVTFAAGAAALKPKEEVRKEGIVYLENFEDGLRALKLIADYDRALERVTEPASRPTDLPAAAELAKLGTGYHTESKVKALLSSYGVKVARETLAASPDGAADAASNFDFP